MAKNSMERNPERYMGLGICCLYIDIIRKMNKYILKKEFMDKIESIINSFLKPYIADNDIQATILTGSYAQENQNKYSDIDIFIVSSDKLNWREQGYKIIIMNN